MAEPVTDDQKTALTTALALAMLTRYRQGAQHVLDARGIDGTPEVTAAAKMALTAFALDRATKVQEGINSRVSAALDSLPDDASDADRQQAVQTVRAGAEQHHTDVLAPYIASYAWHQGLIDTAQAGDAPEGELWTWDQLTNFSDECAEAADASPAPLDELLSIAGGPPPRHERCECQVSLA